MMRCTSDSTDSIADAELKQDRIDYVCDYNNRQ